MTAMYFPDRYRGAAGQRRALVLLAMAVSLTGVAAGAQTPMGTTWREESVVIPGRDGRSLAGTLTLPDTGGVRLPVVVTITGSGGHHRDGNRTAADPYRPFRAIAAALAARGIATLRLDDRGVGESSGNNATADGHDVADDVRVAVDWLRRHSRIDPDRVALVGHSFGGVVAPIVAAGDTTLAAVVLMGAPARNFRETMRYQLAYTIERDTSVPPARRAAVLERATLRQERNAAGSPERWRSWLQDYDPLPTAARVRSPVLILHGRTDRAVPLGDAHALDSTMRASGNLRVTQRIFDDVNHHFQRDPVGSREGYGRLPTQDLAPEVLEALTDWLAESLSRR